MKRHVSRLAFIACACAAFPIARATDWSAKTYDLYFGDFNGDGLTDVLYIAKDPAGVSGIELSDGTGPSIPWQSWASNFLGIPWSGNQYTVIVADFNGDGKADIFLQRNSPGDSYLILTGSDNKIHSVTQTVSSGALGLVWTADQHHLVAGDFNGDGKVDLFLQATSPAGLNAVVLANGNGQFTSGPAQSWNDGYLGFKWATTEANIFAGDFNGDGHADLLLQAKPRWVMIDFDPPFPVPTYPANMNGVVLASSSGAFAASGVQAWSRQSNGVDWSPLTSNIVVGYFNANRLADVVLQGKSSGKSSFLLTGNATGAVFGSGSLLNSNIALTADTYKLSAANFSGAGSGAGLYFQGLTSATTNEYSTSVSSGSVTAAPSSPTIAVSIVDYSYDALGRLGTVTRSGAVGNAVQTTYTFDASGNRQNVTTTPWQ
jgi:hypothetical protein